jgi:hypothetical protein
MASYSESILVTKYVHLYISFAGYVLRRYPLVRPAFETNMLHLHSNAEQCIFKEGV